MAPSPLVSANSFMVAPTQRYPSDEGSPPKFMANANKWDMIWDGSGPPGIPPWTKPSGGAPAPADGGGSGSCWQGYVPPAGPEGPGSPGNVPFGSDPPPLHGQDPPDPYGVPTSLRGNVPETIQKSRKELPKLLVPQNVTSTPAAAVRQPFEKWVVSATLAVTTWTLTMTARDHFVLVVKEARKNLKIWQNAPHQEKKLKMELSYLHGAERPVPPRVSSIEAIMRVGRLEKLPPWLARKCTIQGHYNTVDVLSKVFREMFLHEDLGKLNMADDILSYPTKIPSNFNQRYH
eukprot:1379770-Amphidinium_carterae.2